MNIEQDLVLHKKSFHELTTDELYELLRVRSEVFVVEQNCVYQDLDDDDQKSIHLWLTVADKIVAMACVCPAGTHMKEISIGRVITTERGKCYGKRRRTSPKTLSSGLKTLFSQENHTIYDHKKPTGQENKNSLTPLIFNHLSPNCGLNTHPR